MGDQYFCFLAKFGFASINLALSTDQHIALCCNLLTDDKFWEDKVCFIKNRIIVIYSYVLQRFDFLMKQTLFMEFGFLI